MAWVIKAGSTSVWWQLDSTTAGVWTIDSFGALQFAREQDASAFAKRFVNTRDYEIVELPAAEQPAAKYLGDFFLDVCNACGAKQDSGPCAVCPHIPFFPGDDAAAQHYARRPCRACRSINLRSIRVQVIAEVE